VTAALDSHMMRPGVGSMRTVTVALFGASVCSAFLPGMPLQTAVTMALASLVGFLAARLHTHAEAHAAGGGPLAAVLLRNARFYDDVAVALCLLALLFTLPLR
jgi:hypothetical protein